MCNRKSEDPSHDRLDLVEANQSARRLLVEGLDEINRCCIDDGLEHRLFRWEVVENRLLANTELVGERIERCDCKALCAVGTKRSIEDAVPGRFGHGARDITDSLPIGREVC